MMLIKVRVFPNSSKNKVVFKEKSKKVLRDLYEVYTHASARGGVANREVINLLGNYFGCGVKMVSGGNRSHKIFGVINKE